MYPFPVTSMKTKEIYLAEILEIELLLVAPDFTH